MRLFSFSDPILSGQDVQPTKVSEASSNVRAENSVFLASFLWSQHHSTTIT